MSTAPSERLDAIQRQLQRTLERQLDDLFQAVHSQRQVATNPELEARVGDLLGFVRATEEVSRQLLVTEEELRRQSGLRVRLEQQLPDLQRKPPGEAKAFMARLETCRGRVGELNALRDELIENLTQLQGQLA
ncbi:MAG: hypothetical protein AAGA48_19930 [Myxococcota bacterium]